MPEAHAVFSQLLLDSFPAGLIVTGAALRVRQINRWLLDRLGADAASLVGRPLGEAFPELAERSLLAAYELARERREALRLPFDIHRYFIRLPAQPGTELPEMPQWATIVPLFEADECIGALTIIQDETERRLTELQLQREINKLTALHEIDHAMATLDLSACLQIIVERTRSLFHAENAILLLADGERLTVAADSGYEPSYGGTQISRATGISGWVALHHQSVRVPDVDQDPRYLRMDGRARSEMAAPLLLRGDCLGVINVESSRLEAFSEQDLEMLEALAVRAAAALHNARLHTQEREQRVLADTLNDIALSLATELNPNAILDELLVHVARVVPYDTASIMLFDPRTRQVHMDRARGYEPLGQADEAANFRIPVDTYPNLARMAETRRPNVVPDTTLDPNWVPGELVAHVRSWAGAPIVARGQLLGFLSLDKREADFYTTEKAERLAAFAAAAGLALENARLYAEQQRLALTDGLTGIANRRQFDVTLKRELGRTLRSQRHLGLLMLDLDDFKRFNDIHGHPMGDELLRTIAILLGQSVRTVDAVARYGGEEFAVILPEVEIAEAGRVAERLRRLVAELPLSPAQSGRVTISLGVAVAPDHGHTVEALVQAADRALYQAKRAGKNRVAIYDPEAAAPARTGL